MNRWRASLRSPAAITAVCTTVITLAVLLAYVLEPRRYFTGANGVRPLSVVASIPKGKQLCSYDVTLPAETARVQLALGPEGAPATARLRIRVGGRQVRRADVSVGSFTNFSASFPVLNEPVQGTLCIQAVGGSLVVAGAAGKQSNDRPLTLAGNRLDARIFLRFQPVEGARRSIASQWSTILHRAALFRPEFVAPAVLWMLMLVALPASFVAAVTGLVAGVRGRWAVVLISATAFIGAGSWALITLPFDSPDESEHFAYVQSVAERQTRPDSSPTPRGAYATAQTLALEAVRHPTRIGGPDQRPPWTEAARDKYRERAREALPKDDGGGYADTTRLHLPAYYSLLVPAYFLGGESVLAELTSARLFSALFGVIVALCAYGIVREIAPRRQDLALLAGLLVALQPMFSFISGSVNNDMGVNAAAALVAYLGVRLIRRPSLAVAIAFGCALAITPIMKGTGLALWPPAVIVFAAYLWGRPGWRRAGTAIAAAGAAFVAAGVAVRAALGAAIADGAPGTTTGEGAVGPGILSGLGAKLTYTWELVFPRLPFMAEHYAMAWPFWDIYIVRGWGAFGWYSFVYARPVFIAIVAAGVLIMAAGAAALWRARREFSAWIWEIGFLVAIPVAVLTAVSFAYYTDVPRTVPGEQGRYLFTAAAPLAALASLSFLGFSPRWQRPLAVALLVGMCGLAYLGRLTYLRGVFT